MTWSSGKDTALFGTKDAWNLIRKIYFYSLHAPPYFSFTFLNGPYYHHSFWTMQKRPQDLHSAGPLEHWKPHLYLTVSISHEFLSTNTVFKIRWANNNIKGKTSFLPSMFFCFSTFVTGSLLSLQQILEMSFMYRTSLNQLLGFQVKLYLFLLVSQRLYDE